MPKAPPATASNAYPPVGTLIDGDSLELADILGVGGYGVVYRAVDIRSSIPRSYAVKCLTHSQADRAARRQFHIREIALHQIASAHPGVVTLHRVVEDYNLTYIIMDYAPDHDLFTQILNECRYLGDDALIKHVFLQLLDAVEYCHSLGIYHRDLKPENVLCFDGGFRIAITDFGLATTDKVSDEFRTGSVYHMSPECHGGEFAPTGSYSPMSNDIWSLGIILLNLATGRNPWKSAKADDPTFQAYLRNASGFLPTVLPISVEINDVLTRMLEVDWRERMTLRELRIAIEDVNSFYSEGVIFEGSMARCPWEAGIDIESDSSTKNISVPRQPVEGDLKSFWSADSTSEVALAHQSMVQVSSYGESWTERASCGPTWAFEAATTSYDGGEVDYDTRQTLSSHSSPCDSGFSMPITPHAIGSQFGNMQNTRPTKPLMIDTNIHFKPRYYNGDGDSSSDSSYSPGSSMMHTAVETPFTSSLHLASVMSHEKASISITETLDIVTSAATEDKEIVSPSPWAYASTEASFLRYPSSDSSVVSCDISFAKADIPSPDDIFWPDFRASSQRPAHRRQTVDGYPSGVGSSAYPATGEFVHIPSKANDVKFKPSTILNPIKFFPRSPPPPFGSSRMSPPHGRRPSEPPSTLAIDKDSATPFPSSSWIGFPSSKATTALQMATAQDQSSRRVANVRSPRHWFLPAKFFTSTADP